MHNEHNLQKFNYDLLLAAPFLLLILAYIFAVFRSNQHYKHWPLYRIIAWKIGIFSAMTVVIGPLADRIHIDFVAHMVGHLLLGMIAPLLIVLSAPMTLLLRCIPVNQGRQITKLLKRLPVQLLTNPIIASLLNMGGLWLLYSTKLYSMMHQNLILYIFIHIHVFIAGYLFTASMIYIDPTPHRKSYVYRAVNFILATASHGILAKSIYLNPPPTVLAPEAEKGAMLMYYGGDAVDIIIIIIFCFQWYKACNRKSSLAKKTVKI